MHHTDHRFFDPPGPYAFKEGDIYLGETDAGLPIGISTERAAIAIAASRTGKGAAIIIPNLLMWEQNTFCIDPSGENVAATWQELENRGKRVALLDPFHCAERLGVPARLRVSVNLLDGIRRDSLTCREDIRVIADGLVMRYKADDATWDNGSVTVLAGLIAHVAADPHGSPERTLAAVRELLLMPAEARDELFNAMAEETGFGNLAKAAAAVGLSKSKKAQAFVEGAADNTEWLDSEPMAALLGKSTFQLSELKTGKVALFLIIPHEYIGEHGRFLRLFVRAAIDSMTKLGKAGRSTLFLLDEFHSLGHLSEFVKAAGALPKFGVHLFPFLQDLGQLHSVYGHAASQTFFANADATIFFGINQSDRLTLEHICALIGTRQRVDAGTIARLIGKGNDVSDGKRETIARSMIVFAKAGDILNLRLSVNFNTPAPLHSLPLPIGAVWDPPESPEIPKSWDYAIWATVLGGVIFTVLGSAVDDLNITRNLTLGALFGFGTMMIVNKYRIYAVHNKIAELANTKKRIDAERARRGII